MDKIIMGEIINKNISSLVLFVLLIIIYVPPVSGELSAAAKEAELFEKAYEYYISYHPDKALESFDLFLNKFPDSSAQDSALFWKAKSLIQLNEKDEAEKIFSRIKEQFPESFFGGFAEKELENIGRIELFTVVTKEVRKDKTAKLPDADAEVLTQALKQVASDYEQKIKLLRDEKRDLDRELAELLKKSRLTEKGLTRAIDDRNTLEETVEKERKKNEELSERLVRAKTVGAEEMKLLEENRLLKDRLKEAERSIQDNNESFNRLKGEREKLKKSYDALYNALVKKNKKRDIELASLKNCIRQYQALVLKIEEKELRNYYETNKEEFLVNSGEKPVKILSIDYTSKNELDKALLAVEFQNAAMGGESFEHIYKSSPDILVFKQMKSTELPKWVEEKTEGLKNGEISNVISVENRFIILQMQSRKPFYRKYEDVFTEIQRRLAPKNRVYCQDLDAGI